MTPTYELIDSGNASKLERFGPYVLERPCAQAVWHKAFPKAWEKGDASFSREKELAWTFHTKLAKEWTIEVEGITFRISPTDFGHLGIFPEQVASWRWIQEKVQKAGRDVSVLNLFAYSGGSTLAAASAGATVCHLDASKGMVEWARENARLNSLEKHPIRWIVDDALKFLEREKRRGRFYDAIVLDPPTFGRGGKGEIFKIERDILELLDACRSVLSQQPLFVLFSCHTPGFTPLVMEHLLADMMHGKGRVMSGEMVLEGKRPVPSGTFARWDCP